jgi:hypothetical protein
VIGPREVVDTAAARLTATNRPLDDALSVLLSGLTHRHQPSKVHLGYCLCGDMLDSRDLCQDLNDALVVARALGGGQ